MSGSRGNENIAIVLPKRTKRKPNMLKHMAAATVAPILAGLRGFVVIPGRVIGLAVIRAVIRGTHSEGRSGVA